MATFSLSRPLPLRTPHRSTLHLLPKHHTHTPTPTPRRRSHVVSASSELGTLKEDQRPTSSPLDQELHDLEDSLRVLKLAAKTRRVSKDEVLAALAVVKKAKVERDDFLETLGGVESPGLTWMLIFTAKGRLEKGSYFPVTAVQRFDATARRIENGVYLGPIGCLTFEGRFSWKKRMLAFVFERVGIKVGPFGPFQVSLGGDKEREPGTKDPFFIWFYIDEEIAVAQGKGGGVAFWCRCSRIT